MYNRIKRKQKVSTLTINNSYEGETIEQKVHRIVNNREPITDNAPLNYSDREQGVLAESDIRTDRFEVAQEAMDKISKSHRAKREARIVEMKAKKEGNKGEEGPNPSTAPAPGKEGKA